MRSAGRWCVIRIESSPQRRVRVIGMLEGSALRMLFDLVGSNPVVLDLSDVHEADAHGVHFLTAPAADRWRLVACPNWLAHWIERERSTEREAASQR